MADGTHQSQLKNSKYRNWVKAGLGLKYVNEALEPFCGDIIRQQHTDVLSQVKLKHNVTTVTCGTCQWQTLQPDHVQTKSKQCPLGQVNCNCRHPGGKFACPNNVCGAIYDEIIKLHASTPPAPNWRNTDTHQWDKDPWSIAKCFINAPGYAQVLPAKIDSSGLLHIIINNKGLHNHIQCVLSGSDVFSKVRECRNAVFHCNNMELEDGEVNMYLDNMISVLLDGKELSKRQESQTGVQKILELKREDFIITTTNEDEVQSAMATLSKMEQEFKVTIETANSKLDLKESEMEKRIDHRVKEVENTLIQKQITLDNKFDEKGVNVERKIEQKVKEIEKNIDQKRLEIEVKLDSKQSELENKFDTQSSEIDMNLFTKASEIEKKFDKRSIEIEQKFDIKGTEIEKNVFAKGIQIEQKCDIKGIEIEKTLDRKAAEIEMKLDTKSIGIETKFDTKGVEIEMKLYTKGIGIEKKFDTKGAEIDMKLDMKAKEFEKKFDEKSIGVENKFDKKAAETEMKLNTQTKELEKALEQKENEIEKKVFAKESEFEVKLAQKGKKVQQGIDLKETEMEKKLEEKEAQMERRLDDKMSDVEFKLDKRGTEQKQQLLEISADMKKIASVNETIYQRYREENEAPRNALSAQETEKDLQLEHTCTYTERKKDFQRELIQMYNDNVVKVSVLPVYPERRMANINEVYVDPWITMDIKKSPMETPEEKTISMAEIFRKCGRRKKLVYVLGEAGSGKSYFCKSLVHSWCFAHSIHGTKYDSNLVITEEMKNFEFLFYITLRHNIDCDSIHTMLNKQYYNPVLDAVLLNEPEKCIILLDGLDEWSQQKQDSQFQTIGLPTRDLRKGYTVLTTSRPWKFQSLDMLESEIDLKINLKGINPESTKIMAKKSITFLNATLKKDKRETDFEERLNKSSVSSISHIPIMLQHMICLWFDGELRETSMVATYTSILKLLLRWAETRGTGDHDLERMRKKSRSPMRATLPGYLDKHKICQSYSHALHHLSRLAFETLFGNVKDQSLTFTETVLQKHKIHTNVASFGLKTGILVKDKSISLSLSTPVQSTYSFCHKSLQEYLTAVYIATEFERLTESASGEKFKQFAMKYFGACRTVEDILDQSYVFVMLCGLEPCLVSNLTKYINIIVNLDQKFSNYRHTQRVSHVQMLYEPIELWNNYNVYEQIQECIGLCIKECNCKPMESSIYIRDITSIDLLIDKKRTGLDIQSVCSDSVRSINISLCCFNAETDKIYRVLNHLTSCVKLKAIAYTYGIFLQNQTIKKVHDEKVSEVLLKNSSTLETVVLILPGERLTKSFITVLPDMHHIITLMVVLDRLSHDACCSLCTLLTHCVHLQQLSVSAVCRRFDSHKIDLSKHNRLQFVEVYQNFYVSNIRTSLLEQCFMSVNTHNVDDVCESLRKADKLKYIILENDEAYSLVNKQMAMLLPHLASPVSLCLDNFNFTENIIVLSPHVKNLKEIYLINVTMDLRVWQKFIDSLLAIPHAVRVNTRQTHITGLPETPFMFEDEAAHRYVKKKLPFYHIPKNWNDFSFCTMEF